VDVTKDEAVKKVKVNEDENDDTTNKI
jgi:hypothetical protein